MAQEAIVQELKTQYIAKDGLPISVDKYRPNRYEGAKEERMHATLAPRYENGTVWHYKGGYIDELEQELRMQNPPHDDIKDALANAINIGQPPAKSRQKTRPKVIYHPRFGGVMA